MRGALLIGVLALIACAPRTAPVPFTGTAQRLAVSSLVSPFARGALERIVREEIAANPTLRARVDVIPQDQLERALGGSPPQNWSAANFMQLGADLNASLFLSGRVALSASTRQASLRLSSPRGLIGEYTAETTAFLIAYPEAIKPEDARDVIRLALERLGAGLAEVQK